MGAAAPSSHISSAQYRHSHWHEHEGEYSLGRTRALAESINDRFTNNLAFSSLLPSPPYAAFVCCYCPTSLVLTVLYNTQA